MITVKNLYFDYPGTRALNNISFTIKPGTITALVGPNGAGKTTLLRCLSALESPTFGHITIDGWNADKHPRKIHKISSYLSDFFGLYDDLTVEQSLTYIAWSQLCPPHEVKEKVQITAQKLELLDYLKVPAGQLSRGLRQKLAIAQTIVHLPKILFLDEPASGLDPVARHNLSKLLVSLAKSGITLVVSSHILAELEDYSTHMLVIAKGKIIEQCSLKHPPQTKNTKLNYKIILTRQAKTYIKKIQEINGIEITKVENVEVFISLDSKKMEPSKLLKTLIELNIPVEDFSQEKVKMQDVYLDATKK